MSVAAVEKEPKQPYPYRFRFLDALLGIIATAGVVAFLGWTAFGQQVKVETRTIPQPALTSSSTVADAKAREGDPVQTVDGEQLGFPAGTACDVYELADGLKLICYQGTPA